MAAMELRLKLDATAIESILRAAFPSAKGDWVKVETRRGAGACRLKVSLTDSTAPGVLVTGMGWWLPQAAGPEFGVLDININAALSYAGPSDPASGSADTRGIACRVALA